MFRSPNFPAFPSFLSSFFFLPRDRFTCISSVRLISCRFLLLPLPQHQCDQIVVPLGSTCTCKTAVSDPTALQPPLFPLPSWSLFSPEVCLGFAASTANSAQLSSARLNSISLPCWLCGSARRPKRGLFPLPEILCPLSSPYLSRLLSCCS